MKTIQEILGYLTLCGLITDPRGGVPDDILPSAFFTTTQPVEGDTGKYFKVEGTRQTARVVAYGSPSKARSMSGVAELATKLVHSLENITHDPTVLVNVSSENAARQRLGESQIARQTAEFRQLFNNLRISAVTSMLVLGAIHFDGDGNLLPSSTGAVTTIDYGVPDGNQDQLDILGDGDIIDASWATAGTDIPLHCKQVVSQIRKKNGYRITTAYYGENVPTYLLGNTLCKELINNNNAITTELASGTIPDGFLGLKWRPIADAFYVDNDGSIQTWAGGDTVVFTPDVSRDWYEMQQGTYPVPTSVEVQTNAAAAAASIALREGMFSYAKVVDDPTSIKQVAGDTFLPVLKVPGAIAIADVTP